MGVLGSCRGTMWILLWTVQRVSIRRVLQTPACPVSNFFSDASDRSVWTSGAQPYEERQLGG